MMSIEELLVEMYSLPKGSIVYKTIKGKKQPYLQWREDGKVKSKYIKSEELEKMERDIARRRQVLVLYDKAVKRLVNDRNRYMLAAEDVYEIGHYIEQELITKKQDTSIYSVDRNYVNSKLFHDKFLGLPLSSTIKEKLYKEVGRLLEFVDGKSEERMSAISRRTGELIIDNFDRQGADNHTSFNNSEYEKINSYIGNVIVIHNHPLCGRPSGQDIVTYVSDEKIYLSIIACHNGDVYAICSGSNIVVDIYQDLLEKEKEQFSDIEIAKIFATNKLYKLNDSKGSRHKLFEIRRL